MILGHAMNTLYYGDNLDVLRRYIPDESIDLVYLDPPFQSGRDYNALFEEKDGSKSAAQIQAFEDTWEWDQRSATTFDETVSNGGKVADALLAFRQLLGGNSMLAYLSMMAPRLVELRRVLRTTGSLYLHCDPTASHYLKLVLDAIFGPEKFVSEITWQRTNAHNDAKRWSPVADTLLFYSKGGTFTWNPVHVPLTEEYVASKYRFIEPDGRRYRLDNMRSPNPRPNLTYDYKGYKPHPNGWAYSVETMERLDREGRIWFPDSKEKRLQLKRYLDEMAGTTMGNVWTDIAPINSQAAERLGYPTQKPVALLERILTASSNEGDVVLDPFCGCGTTIDAAQRLKREWIGIDITHLAVGLIKKRLFDTHGAKPGIDYQVIGEPTDLAGAQQLAKDDRHQFEHWALGLVGARASAHGKGADKGIDGVLLFQEGGTGSPHKKVIISVKSGHLSAPMVRELPGIVDREKAAIGLLIALDEPSAPMRREAASAGFYESPWGKHPKVQILTVEELLSGKSIDMPPIRQGGTTFKQAQRAKKKVEQGQLF